MYFQDRYASFYLMAVSCSEKERKDRLEVLGYSEQGVSSIDAQEGTGQDVDNLKYYSAQNIPACLQRSDIYLHNPTFHSKTDSLEYIKRQIVRFVSLMHMPGIVTPSATERCMQVAYTAKLNSGCISRQVGAVITDSDYAIKSVGWNDVPSGHVPCNLRNRFDLAGNVDETAYSEYEKMPEFKQHIKSKNGLFTSIVSLGRNPSFCFKSEYRAITGKDNQVHTRALHAEENAFLQISKYGGMSLKGNYLFSTASPCELCAKKSVQLGISKIFYIDPYPGIAESHILAGGVNQPEMNIFAGAIGRAFHNLYSPTLPYKDELAALQFA
jgi:deoxycytidylate deaminase